MDWSLFLSTEKYNNPEKTIRKLNTAAILTRRLIPNLGCLTLAVYPLTLESAALLFFCFNSSRSNDALSSSFDPFPVINE